MEKRRGGRRTVDGKQSKRERKEWGVVKRGGRRCEKERGGKRRRKKNSGWGSQAKEKGKSGEWKRGVKKESGK